MAASKGHINASRGLAKYLTLNAAFNAYFLRNIAEAADLRGWSLLPLLPIFVLGSAGPIYCHAIIRRGAKGALASFCATLGYSWCGISLLSFFIFASVDLAYALGLAADYAVAGGHIQSSLPLWSPAAASVAISALICSSALVNAGAVRQREIVVETDKDLGREIRIAHLSDTHFSIMTGAGHAKRIAKAVRKAAPDLLVATGDILDAGRDIAWRSLRHLAAIECPLGKYAVLGNHERAAGVEQSVGLLREAGFVVLRSEAVEAGPLLVAGVDDDALFPTGTGPAESSYLPRDDRFTILLKHRPIPGDAGGRVDLQLSGHTHGGQIFPFTLAVRAHFQYVTGLFRLDDGRRLFVTNGAGTWGPPMRFLAPQEIALIRVTPKAERRSPARDAAEVA